MSTTLPVPLLVYAQHQSVLDLEPARDVRATLPVANSTKSFWFTDPDVTPLPTEGSEGPLTDDADICIIGSGITGASAAYHLARSLSDGKIANALGRPVKAVILEAREFCSGATGRNGGHLVSHTFFDFLKCQTEHGKEEALRSYNIEEYVVKEVTKLLEENSKGDDVDLVAGGRLILFFSKEELLEAKSDFLAAKEIGLDLSGIQWFTKEETQAKYGASYPSVLTPGFSLWPLKLVGVLFSLANKIGSGSSSSSPTFSATLHTRTPVTSILPIPQSSDINAVFPRRHNLNTPRGNISCSYIVHATNGYASHLLPHLTGSNGIIPTRGQIIATRAKVGLDILTRTGGTGNEGLEYWFPRPVKQPDEKYPLVILGGGREVKPQFQFYEIDDSIIDKEVGKALRAFLPAVFPGRFEPGNEPEIEWTGIMGFTRSGDPFVGPVVDHNNSSNNTAYEGQYVSAGYTGHGMPRAYACAEVVSQMIVADIKKEKWEPPEWFPRVYLMTNANRKEYAKV
ncbi:unnamed protein product [Somion occarium]|uniref:FAD dependent oxidoreductase domain-containing protein n=1 Tax=Somion occarium TaxID=3059160 RepID=A0ABP1E441_9APHY